MWASAFLFCKVKNWTPWPIFKVHVSLKIVWVSDYYRKGWRQREGGWVKGQSGLWIHTRIWDSHLNPFIPTETSINQKTFFAKFQQKLSILIRILLESKETWQLFVPFSKIIFMFRSLKWNLWRQWDKNISMMIEGY